ncbi:MAG: phytanoyl-CoA dioxygenase family protein [Paracoccaceae bacterium]
MMFSSLKRRAMVKPEASYYYWRYAVNSLRTWRAMRHVPAYSDTARIAQELEEEGIVRGDTSVFLTGEGQRHFAEVSRQMLETSRSPEVREILESDGASVDVSGNPKKASYLVNLLSRGEVYSPDSALIKLVLDAKLLEIIAAYLGLWPRVHAVNGWLNFPTDDTAQASQMWHRDPEDLKMIKVFIYLVDVDEDRGPFSFVPKTHSFGADAGKVPEHKDRKRITDEEINLVFPPEKHLICTGPANTMVLADTVGYHRGGKPRSGNRILLNITYTSAWPSKRQLSVRGKPSWQMNEMQRRAL